MIAKNLLSPECYSLSNVVKRKRVSDSDIKTFKKLLTDVAPTFDGVVINDYEFIGKTTSFNYFLAKKGSDYYNVKIARKKGAVAQNTQIKKEKDLSNMNLTTKKLRNTKIDDSLFIPMKSNTPIDYCFSNEGGIMPGTNYIVIGDPGIGKSSLSIQYAAEIIKSNPKLNVLFISAEMTEIDMIPYTKRFPLWLDVETLFVSELTDGLYKESIETKLKEGFDLVLIDSFAELADSIRGDYNETVSGKDKKSYNDIEKFLVDQMIVHNKADNQLSKHTSFISIQQMTKGGNFVGSNKLKHNTTGMLELRYTKSGERKVVVSKNRRGFEYDNLHFSFQNDVENPIHYDIERIKRDKRVQEEIKKAAQEQLDDELATDKWFDSLGADVENTPIEIEI